MRKINLVSFQSGGSFDAYEEEPNYELNFEEQKEKVGKND